MPIIKWPGPGPHTPKKCPLGNNFENSLIDVMYVVQWNPTRLCLHWGTRPSARCSADGIFRPHSITVRAARTTSPPVPCTHARPRLRRFPEGRVATLAANHKSDSILNSTPMALAMMSTLPLMTSPLPTMSMLPAMASSFPAMASPLPANPRLQAGSVMSAPPVHRPRHRLCHRPRRRTRDAAVSDGISLVCDVRSLLRMLYATYSRRMNRRTFRKAFPQNTMR